MNWGQVKGSLKKGGFTEERIFKLKVKNWASLMVQWLSLPCNAGDTGSISALGRSHMLWGNEALVPQL